jgi:adenine-specific DNA methylase
LVPEDTCPKLIEVALPIREISAESVRDKNIHHAHISHLHIWWARRPLAATRAVVFASLVPDPDDPRCPEEFRKAVERHLKSHVPEALKHYMRGRNAILDSDPYRPYDGVPDTLRNRLLMFIAKWSPEALAFESGKREEEPKPAQLLDERSLVKWETGDPENPRGREILCVARELVKVAHGGKTPLVLDPFAGGGAIPLEAARLGCQAIANDYNPVAYLVLRATCEFPQKYGRPGKRRATVEEFGKKIEREIDVPNVLAYDVEKWAKWILERARDKIGQLYPPGEDGRPVLAYLWARTVPCSNTSCRAEIPLLRNLLLRSSERDKVGLKLEVDKAKKEIKFRIARGKSVRETEGTKRQRGPAICPYCEQPNREEDLRRAATSGLMGRRMVAVVVKGKDQKDYRAVEKGDMDAVVVASAFESEAPGEYIVPEINGPNGSREAGSHRSINLELYGFTRWGQLFNHRQLVVLNELVQGLHETFKAVEQEVPDTNYGQALAIYLGLWIDRIAAFTTTMCRWAAGSEIIKTPFSGQSVPMMWDFPEVNPFADSSGGAITQLRYMLDVIGRGSSSSAGTPSPSVLLGSATCLPIETSSCDCVVTDPPYGNSIAYADLSDFFYCWLKRSLGGLLPNVFSTPQTPKAQEATSHKHRHHGSRERANEHYQRLLTDSFRESKRAAREPKLVCVMFAHQSTEAWSSLISALFDSSLSPLATWPIATEMPSTALALGTSSLETSVTVSCRPRMRQKAVSLKDVHKEIETAVQESVRRFWGYGFRGADLIVATYGPAVGVFGKHERVEKADGTLVEIPELLELARKAARDAIAGEFRGDNLSTLYYVWTNLYGASQQAWDDARLVVQIGGDADDAMEVARGRGIFVVDGSVCRLALLADRAKRRGLGLDPSPPLIDTLHRALLIWKEEKRSDLVTYLAERGLLEDGPFWKLAQSLFEVLPHDLEDRKLVSALLGERETLRAQGMRMVAAAGREEAEPRLPER